MSANTNNTAPTPIVVGEALPNLPEQDEKGNLIPYNRMVNIVCELQHDIVAEIRKIDSTPCKNEYSTTDALVKRPFVIEGDQIEKAAVLVTCNGRAAAPKHALLSFAQDHPRLKNFLEQLPASQDKVIMKTASISLIIHPKNPYAPTVHANFRYFEYAHYLENEAPIWWVAGGTDLTPHYVFDEDCILFHQELKQAMDKYDPSYYPLYKKECDDYFFLPHRNIHRGIGGVFFDDLSNRPVDELMNMARDCGRAFVKSYFPIVHRRMNTQYGPQQIQWQELGHGRYVEFNLMYDKGTKYGLQYQPHNVKNILASLPLTVRYEYDTPIQPHTPEAYALNVLVHPRNWLA